MTGPAQVRQAERRPRGYDYRQRRPGSKHVLAGGVDAGQGAVARVASELPRRAPRRRPGGRRVSGGAGARLSTPGPALPLDGFAVGAETPPPPGQTRWRHPNTCWAGPEKAAPGEPPPPAACPPVPTHLGPASQHLPPRPHTHDLGADVHLGI